MASVRVFVSYGRADPGEAALARAIADALREAGAEVFLDRDMGPGVNWSREIEAWLDGCDAFCVLVSADSITSPYVCDEIIRIGDRRRREDGRPELWPICCNYTATPPPHVSSHLRLPNRIEWHGEADTPLLLKRLVAALREMRPASGALPALCPLPHRIGDFTGREAELERLCTALTSQPRRASMSAVGGMGGVGKTTLAVEAAWRVAHEFPDGVLFIDLRGVGQSAGSQPTNKAPSEEPLLSPGSTGGPSRQGRGSPDGLGPPVEPGDSHEAGTAGVIPLTPAEIIGAVVEQLVPTARLPDGLAARLPYYRKLLAGRRLLLLLDNARDTAQVKDLLPPEPVALIVTSRKRLVLAGAERIDLDVLPEAEAVALLREIMDGVDAGEAELSALASACGRLPLALRAAGAFLTTYDWSVADYLAELQRRRLAMLSEIAESDPALDVQNVLGFSLEQLAREDASLAGRFAVLAVFPAGFDAEAAAAVWQVEVAAARHALGQLAVRSLVRVEAAGRRWRLHDLVRDLAAERLDPAEREAAEARHAEHYRKVLAQARDLFLQGHDDVLAGLALFDLERAGIEAGQAWAARHWQACDDAARLAYGYTNAGAHVLSLRLPARQRIAWLETAVAACRRLGDRQGLGNALGNLGLAYADLGETRKAIEHCEQQLVITREIGDRRGEGNALGNLGNAWAALGEPRKAIEHYEQQLVITRAIGDRRGEGNALGNLGIAWKNLGEPRKAIEHYEQQLVIAREIGDRLGESIALWNGAQARDRNGERERAISDAMASLSIKHAIEDPWAAKVEAWLRERGVDPESVALGS